MNAEGLSDADTDRAEEQLFAVLDIDAVEGASDGEIYIVSSYRYSKVLPFTDE